MFLYNFQYNKFELININLVPTHFKKIIIKFLLLFNTNKKKNKTTKS